MTNFETLERYRPIIDDWDAFCAALERPLPICALTNTNRTDRDTVRGRLAERGIKTRPLDWHPNAFVFETKLKVGNTFEYVAGLFNVQEEAALTASVVLEPEPTERVLDLCAAPGNKTVQIALAMNNRGTVIGNDRSPARMRAIRSAIDRMGLVNISTLHHDGSNLPRECGEFDRILVDVPCSCEGTSRKNPKALKNAHAQIPKLVGPQRALLKRAVELCRDGGTIVYATCTYAPEENEFILDDVLKEVGDALEVVPTTIEGFKSSPGVTNWEGRDLDPRLSHALRVWPHHNDTGGFFVATLRKRGPSLADELVFDVPDDPLGGDDLLGYFGIKKDDDLRFVRPSTKSMQVIRNEHEGLPSKFVSGVGLPFANVARNFPKLSTCAAMAFGAGATKQCLELDRLQTTQYLSRKDVDMTPLPERGFYIVRHDGIALGLAWCDGETVQSQYPKAFAIAPEVDPFAVY